MLWIIEKKSDKLHELVFHELEEMARNGEPYTKSLGETDDGNHEIYLIYDLEDISELVENVKKLFNQNKMIDMIKECKEVLVISNLGSPFQYDTFEFAISRPAENIHKILEELLFDLFTYNELWLLEAGVEDLIQIYTDRKFILRLFKFSRYKEDIAVLEPSLKLL